MASKSGREAAIVDSAQPRPQGTASYEHRERRVVVDTQSELTGRTLDSVEQQLSFSDTRQGFSFSYLEEGPQRQVIYSPTVGYRSVPLPVERQYDLMMTVPASNINDAWKQLLPKLGLPALVALMVAGVVLDLVGPSWPQRLARPAMRPRT